MLCLSSLGVIHQHQLGFVVLLAPGVKEENRKQKEEPFHRRGECYEQRNPFANPAFTSCRSGGEWRVDETGLSISLRPSYAKTCLSICIISCTSGVEFFRQGS